MELEVEGFASLIQRLVFPLDNPGLNIIQAPNGFGKTSIISALCWVLYGKPLKEKSTVETWEKVRPKSYQGTYGSVTFRTGNQLITVKRCKNYKGTVEGARGDNRTIIIIDGQDYSKLASDNRDKKDIQTKIVELVGMSYSLFKSSVVFGQKVKRIIDETNPAKKEVFEEAFEASFINQALDRAKKEVLEKQTEYRDLTGKIGVLEAKLDYGQEKLKSIKELKEEYSKDKAAIQNKLEETSKALEAKQTELNALPKIDKTLKAKQTELNTLEKSLKKANQLSIEASEIKSKLAIKLAARDHVTSVVKTLEDKINNLNPLCSACGQKVSKEVRAQQKEALQKEVATHGASLSELLKVVSKLGAQSSKITHLQKEIGPVDVIESKLGVLQRELKALSKNQMAEALLKKDIENLGNTLSHLNTSQEKLKGRKITPSDIKKSKLQLKAIKDELKPLVKLYKALTAEIKDLIWVINGPLSNKGLKAYIFNTMLTQVNEYLLYYSKYLGFQIEFGIDLDSARKDFYTAIYKQNQICSYEDLSGGQQQLVNVALALAIHDTMYSNPDKATNLLIFDEVFENLDETNTDLVAELIATKTKNKSIYLITHNKEFNASNSNIISLAYQAGGTQLN